ncbi:hypothetical protein PtB15_10B354 [Puccinia triticina]|nr:hypothetical protein PtB15_10B354 [Puccinia triticina]
MAETTASTKAQDILDNIRAVVDALGTVEIADEAKSSLLKLAALFSRENNPVTSVIKQAPYQTILGLLKCLTH